MDVVYWACAVVAALFYVGIAVLVGRFIGVNDRTEDQ